MDSAPDKVWELARFSIALLDLVNMVMEKGILPIALLAAVSFASVAAVPTASNPTGNRPRVEQGTAELKAALAAAEKTAVVFNANLGQSPVANMATLNGAFAARLKATTLKVASERGDDANESIRVVKDALNLFDRHCPPNLTIGTL